MERQLEPQGPRTAKPTRQPWPHQERRKHWRYPCAGEALVRKQGADVSLQGQLSDISLGGCYVDMTYPLPPETGIELMLTVDQRRVRATGRVCASREGFGMGVSFTDIDRANQAVLEDLVNWLAGSLPQGPTQRAPSPTTADAVDSIESETVAASSNPDTDDAMDALLGLLERKGVINAEERAEVAKKREAHVSR